MATSLCRPLALAVLLGTAAWLRAEPAPLLPPEIVQRGIVDPGDPARLQQALFKARQGGKVTLAFLGGSITEGAWATAKPNRYVDRVGAWWRAAFPEAAIDVVNAGIGATGSDFGALRLQRDVLSRHPDLIVVDFAVNDDDTAASARTLEGLVRHALDSPGRPAVILLFMVRKTGASAQDRFAAVGRHYGLPMVSYRDAVWPEIEAGRMKWEEITHDAVHPNDLGHGYVAQLLDALFARALDSLPGAPAPTEPAPLPAPLADDLYARASFLGGTDLEPLANDGWRREADAAEPKAAGWKADRPGSVLEFETPAASLVAVQFWMIHGPMGKARVRIDEGPAVDLDGWFDQTWGGLDRLQTVARDLAPVPHRVRIELLPDANPQSSGTTFIVTGIGIAGTPSE